MPRPCDERDRLTEAYRRATVHALTLSRAAQAAPLGPEYVAALDDAEAAYLARADARRGFEEHCGEHSCG